MYCRREKVNVSRFFVSVKCPNIYILIQAITASSTPLQNKGTYSRSWPFSIQTWSEVCAGKSSLVPLTSIPFPSQDVTTTHFQFPEWNLLLITLLWTVQESFYLMHNYECYLIGSYEKICFCIRLRWTQRTFYL